MNRDTLNKAKQLEKTIQDCENAAPDAHEFFSEHRTFELEPDKLRWARMLKYYTTCMDPKGRKAVQDVFITQLDRVRKEAELELEKL